MRLLRHSALTRAAIGTVLALAFASCDADSAPTPVPSVATTERPTPPPDVPGTPLPGEITAGEIADRIGIAWSAVSSLRVTRTTSPSGLVASPVAMVSSAVIDEIILPDRHRVTILESGAVLGEIIALGGRIYVRGSLVPGMPAPSGGSGWQTIDLATSASPTPLTAAFAALLQPATPPFSQLSGQERARIARPLGSVVLGDRTCSAFEIPSSTMTGERITVTIALDDNDLPCSISTRSGASETVAVYEYNVALVIDSPL